jgi:D-hydroxyproline dehydrogenase subunit beta
MSGSADVLVIGGGIIGAACAYSLSGAGATVRLLERTFCSSGTSRACDGLILYSDKQSEAELALAMQSAALWAELSATLPADFHYERCGVIVVAETPEGLESPSRRAAQMRAAGVRAEVLDRAGLRSLEPCLAPDLCGGVFYPDEAQVDARLATVALVRAAQRQGARVQEGIRVDALRRDARGQVVAAVTSEGEFSAGAFVLAAGVWSAELALTAGITLPVKPRKGHIVVATPAKRLLAHPLLEGSYAASVQSDSGSVQVALVAEMTAAGTLLLGSSREFTGFDVSVSVPVVRAIADRALRFLPALAHASSVRTYAGLRPWSPDHLPLIGPVGLAPGLCLATGHEGAGIGLAPVTGKLIAEWLTGGCISQYAQAVRPDRFAFNRPNEI